MPNTLASYGLFLVTNPQCLTPNAVVSQVLLAFLLWGHFWLLLVEVNYNQLE